MGIDEKRLEKISDDIAQFGKQNKINAHDLFLSCVLTAARIAKKYDIDPEAAKLALAELVNNLDLDDEQ